MKEKPNRQKERKKAKESPKRQKKEKRKLEKERRNVIISDKIKRRQK